MKALVYHGPGSAPGTRFPIPTIEEPTDAIVRIDSSTICGTDLHILKGDVPEVEPGTILGHEAVGTVVEIGRAPSTTLEAGRPRARLVHHLVRPLPLLQGGPLRPLHRRRRLDLRPPDRRAAGRVRPRAVRGHLRLQGAGRADGRAGALPRRHPPDGLRGRRAQRPRRAGRHGRRRRRRPDRPRDDHDREAVHARARSSRSTSPTRGSRRRASSAPTSTINNGSEDALARVLELTGGLGADVAIEAVGVPETFELCTELVRPGGRVANVGVHGHPATLHLEKLWIRDVTMTTGLVDTFTTPRLLKLIAEGTARRDAVRDAPLPARGDDVGLRHVRRRSGDARAEGRARGRAGRARQLPKEEALAAV